MECPARRTGKVLPLEALYSPTPPYPVNSSLSSSSSAGLRPPSKAAPEARSVEPRKSRRVICESMISCGGAGGDDRLASLGWQSSSFQGARYIAVQFAPWIIQHHF